MMDTSDGLLVMVVACGALAFGGMLAVLWRQVSGIERLSQGDRLARGQERHDESRLVCQLVEKLHSPESFELARTHARERQEQAQLDAALERERTETVKAVQDVQPANAEYLRPEDEYLATGE